MPKSAASVDRSGPEAANRYLANTQEAESAFSLLEIRARDAHPFRTRSVPGLRWAPSHGLDPDDCIPPLTAYYAMKIGRLPLVPYFRPGDAALGEAIRALAGRHCAVLLANHGPVVSGVSLEAAVYAVEELEETAKLFLLLRDAPTRPLTELQIQDLKSVFKLG